MYHDLLDGSWFRLVHDLLDRPGSNGPGSPGRILVWTKPGPNGHGSPGRVLVPLVQDLLDKALYNWSRISWTDPSSYGLESSGRILFLVV
jgi:hypothetical protein